MNRETTYAKVLLPLKISDRLSYRIPGEMASTVSIGSWVKVNIKAKEYMGVVEEISVQAPSSLPKERIKPLSPIPGIAPVSRNELELWSRLADYYMCTAGEVFKAAYNALLKKPDGNPRTGKDAAVPQEEISPLSSAQAKALDSIKDAFSRGKRVLLNGVTGSGKTEIYLHLAKEIIERGGQILYLVPEIAISRQLQQRISKIFGPLLLTYHSGQTIAGRRKAIKVIRDGKPCIVLGTRSAVLLPFNGLRLIVVDEEHDQSYKQADPAPRYNGRDAALILSEIHGSDILLGSATPSFESLYNVQTGKLVEVKLSERYHAAADPTVRIIDTNREYRLHNMRGSFSASLLKEMNSILQEGGQILVFRSRRAYSPIVQCTECGDIPKCPNCNISLSYHKAGNSLSCHYCGYTRLFTTRCQKCGEPALEGKGAGTEKIEEELKELFPDRTVVRFDAETASSKVREEKMIRDFAAHRIDILVGTQMITKGFDFEKLSLVVLLNADTLFAVQDFRSDERAAQLITQLLGRAGRRSDAGRLIIQTAQPEHPVLVSRGDTARYMAERRTFLYPPFVRLITITVKDSNEGRLWNACRMVKDAISECGITSVNGPVSPAVDYAGGQHIREFWIKLARNRDAAAIKKNLSRKIELIDLQLKGATVILPDVDPL
ncbi:MAG: primosomal protein N' [Bacteroidales bacterium]|nr:primosomal protein N' [Candidatus Cacconaster merdequi]